MIIAFPFNNELLINVTLAYCRKYIESILRNVTSRLFPLRMKRGCAFVLKSVHKKKKQILTQRNKVVTTSAMLTVDT